MSSCTISHAFKPAVRPLSQRRLAKQRLLQDRKRAALRLLSDSRTLVDEGLSASGNGRGVGAVEVCDVEHVNRAALWCAVGAAADCGGLSAL